MNTIKILKKQAKTSLEGKWTAAVAGLLAVFAVALFVYLFYAMLGCVSGAFAEGAEEINAVVIIKLLAIFCLTFLLALALLPIKNGFIKLCYSIANGREANFADVFYFFKGTKQYFKALQFNVLTCAKLLAAYLFSFLGYYIFCLGINAANCGDITIFIIMRSMLFACSVIAFILFSIRIIFSEFIFVDDENAPISYISHITKVVFKNHSLDILLLNYSFIPWIALCFFVIPALYVIPYMLTTLATSAKWLIKLYKEGKLI